MVWLKRPYEAFTLVKLTRQKRSTTKILAAEMSFVRLIDVLSDFSSVYLVQEVLNNSKTVVLLS